MLIATAIKNICFYNLNSFKTFGHAHKCMNHVAPFLFENYFLSMIYNLLLNWIVFREEIRFALDCYLMGNLLKLMEEHENGLHILV